MRHIQTYVAHLGVWYPVKEGSKPMGMDQSGVLTVGTLVPKEGGHTLPHNTLLVIPPLE